MKGLITPIAVWALAVAPLVFALCRVPRRVFLWMSCVVGAAGIAAWLASAGAGYRVTENLTGSLGGHVYVHKVGEPFSKGDLVAFRWRGGATYPPGTIFIKRVVGMPGDVVRRVGSEVWVGQDHVGAAKPVSRAGIPLQPAAQGVIPDGEFFVATPNPDSLDSRYSLVGNIKAAEIIGRAYEVF